MVFYSKENRLKLRRLTILRCEVIIKQSMIKNSQCYISVSPAVIWPSLDWFWWSRSLTGWTENQQKLVEIGQKLISTHHRVKMIMNFLSFFELWLATGCPTHLIASLRTDLFCFLHFYLVLCVRKQTPPPRPLQQLARPVAVSRTWAGSRQLQHVKTMECFEQENIASISGYES